MTDVFNAKIRVYHIIIIYNFQFIFDFKIINIVFQFIFHQLNSMFKNNAIFVIEFEKINYDNRTLNFNVIAQFFTRDSDSLKNTLFKIKNMIFNI